MIRPVSLGFLGAGMVARMALAPAARSLPAVRLAAVAARDLQRAEALGPERAYRSYQELLDDADVEAVYVALANDAHLPWALAALRAGKHVLCEKPLALDVAEVELMQAEAQAAGRLLVEASWYQWHPRTARARALLAAGAIGDVRHVEGGFSFAGVGAGNYRLDPSKGGGAAYDVGCYPVSAVLWSAPEVQVVAARARLGPTGVDLSTDLLLDLAGGATAGVHCSIDAPERQWLRITGSTGEIELAGSSFTSHHRSSELLFSDGHDTARETFAACDPYALMLASFCAAVRGEDAWLPPPAQSRACAAVLQAARVSADSGGRPVALP
ncbi:MAG TPA: Gfo/Idh/MocA family oxidoreductase [Mycobacteriales bacterium]|jgi:predicted dehydrogenase|nr:Gfo/Idh/MocA family oxidoreductase [Mycobacteriales bacterium]